MFRLGLTGSIGMGKSTTAKMFAAAGAPVWDADAAVARLYGPRGGAVPALAEIAPHAMTEEDGAMAVDRARLREAVTADPSLIPLLERAVHPLVAEDRAVFLREAEAAGATVAVCDIPLLFEKGSETEFDGVAVVTAPPDVQKERVMARPGMTARTFDTIVSRQMPDAEKRAKARWIIDTGAGMEAAEAAVENIMREIAGA